MKVSINKATRGLNHHHYTPITLSSIDFGDLLPIRTLEVVPSDNFTKIHGNGFMRIAPQGFPPYGRSMLKTASFFVPYHQLLDTSDAFFQNMSVNKGQSVVMPRFQACAINDLFEYGESSPISYTGSISTLVATHPVTDTSWTEDYDYMTIENNAGSSKFKLHKLGPIGRKWYKILKSLGYDFVSYPHLTSYQDASAVNSKIYYNALPLLAFFKIYCDYFVNPNFYNNEVIVDILRKIKQGNDVSITQFGGTVYDSSTGVMSNRLVWYMLAQMHLPHEKNDYLTAWNNLVNPNGVSPAGVKNDENYPVGPVFYDTSAARPSVYANDTQVKMSSNAFTQQGLNMLQSFYKWIRRHNLFGSKAAERVFAMFGVKPDEMSDHYVAKLFEGVSPIDFTAVMSNGDTSSVGGKTLGSFAGYGQAALNIDFSYQSHDYGMIISLAWLQIVPIITSGVNPSVLRINPFDWYTPEFDGKACRAIANMELAANHPTGTNLVASTQDFGVYGFFNLYDDYRFQRDSVAGDFVNDNAKDFMFARNFNLIRSNANAQSKFKPQSYVIQCYDELDNADLSNPFQFDATVADRFWLKFDWDIDAMRPVLSRPDSLDLTGEGDTSLELGGNQMQ